MRFKNNGLFEEEWPIVLGSSAFQALTTGLMTQCIVGISLGATHIQAARGNVLRGRNPVT